MRIGPRIYPLDGWRQRGKYTRKVPGDLLARRPVSFTQLPAHRENRQKKPQEAGAPPTIARRSLDDRSLRKQV
jgi:hypothetical protein